MTWTSADSDQIRTAQMVVLWIATARAAGYGGGPDWLPSGADFYKSALFERIRSGKAPLDHPPPIGFACPWYAVVEDPGPHHVGSGSWAPHFGGPDTFWPSSGQVAVLQHTYRIVETTSPTDCVIADFRGDTPYRFRLWHDPDWKHPSRDPDRPATSGGWFMQRLDEGAPWLSSDKVGAA